MLVPAAVGPLHVRTNLCPVPHSECMAVVPRSKPNKDFSSAFIRLWSRTDGRLGSGFEDESTSAFGQPWEAARKGVLCAAGRALQRSGYLFVACPPSPAAAHNMRPAVLACAWRDSCSCCCSPSRTPWQVAQMHPPRCILERLSGRGSV